jgi:hypothetical protein
MAWEPKVRADWDGDEQLMHLMEERTLLPEDTPWEVGKRDLYAYFPMAVRSVGQLSAYASMEHIRLKASEFIIAKTMELRELETSGKGGALEEFIESVSKFANNPK